MDHALQWLLGFGMFAVVLAILAGLFWLWMLIDCLANPRLIGVEKIVWLLIVFFLPVIGSIIYFFVGRMGQKVF